jgi:hypothetical protein
MKPERCAIVLALSLSFQPFLAAEGRHQADVVIYGGTAGGVMAAIAAAGEGVDTILLEPGRHLGGMLTGGLGRTDMDRQQHVIGGFAREFFVRAGRHYGEPVAWTFEPSVATRILQEWLDSTSVRILLEHRLDSVETRDGRIAVIRTENGAEFHGRIFIDASYEGDLMAGAGVSYVVGREGREVYGESLAGVKEIQPGNHQLHAIVSPFDVEGRLLPSVIDESEVGPVGSGDHRVQAYCFRLCITDVPENRIPFPRPEHYDPARYELLARYLKAAEQRFGRAPNPLGISRVPNGKTDVNSGGPISTNLLSASWEYPEADYARRAEIWNEHLSWAQGMLYFLSHDPAVPEYLREEMAAWGLPRDEFVDTGHWPHQLYVREGRRMKGEYVMTQHDLETQRRKYDSIGMGGYNMDVREVQWVAKTVYRFPDPRQEVLMEGYITVHVEPYEIPYRSLLPKIQESDNLLVTSCVSASHMAYSSIRMEPQYMILGQAAGVAAALAIKAERAPHHIDLVQLQARLRDQGQILSLEGAIR